MRPPTLPRDDRTPDDVAAAPRPGLGASARRATARLALLDARSDGWLGALGTGAVAAALRLPALGRPDTLVFDETYYVKDAWTLLHLGYEGQWGPEPDPAFVAGDVDGWSSTAAYVVHPPVGKWLIAGGLDLLGAQDPVGWRLASVVAGILAVVLLARIARRLLRSSAWGALAGLLLAVDGAAIVHSRTALLDGLLMALLVAALGALVVDRDRARGRLARATAPPRAPTAWGPSLGLRPWRLLAGVLLGLAVGTKWSALWFVAVLGLITVAWDAAARHRAGIRRWAVATLARDAVPAFVSIVPVAALTYVASWAGWLATSGGYDRDWAARHPGEGVAWLPPALRSLVAYHQEMWRFHTGLEAEHAYAAHPLGWLVQWRPTSFFYESPEPAQQWCGADRCAQAVTSLGNPLIWWLAAAALVACAALVVRRRDGVALTALALVGAGWLPWFAYAHRTIFTFYAIVVLPWLVLGLVRVAQVVVTSAPPWARDSRRAAVAGVVAVVVGVSLFFWPVWTGQVVTFRFWQLHQWLPSWI